MVLYHRKAEPVRCQLRIAVEIVPDGCDKQCQEKHQNAYDAQIASGNRWQIIVLCLLYEVKKAGRQDEHAGRVVNHQNDLSLQNITAGRIRALCIADLRKRIQPFVRYQCLGKTLLRHGQRLHMDFRQLSADIIQQILIRQSIHIAQHDITFAHGAQRMVFHSQMCIADSSPY